MARVLVIEDRRSIGMVFEAALSEVGHKVEVVSDGETGLERLYAEPRPDILLVDLKMPGISGREVVVRMRKEPELCQIPVIIISGSLPAAENLPPEGSYQAFIAKPFDLDEVLQTVERLTASDQACCA